MGVVLFYYKKEYGGYEVMRKKVLCLMLAVSLSISGVTPIAAKETIMVVNAASTEENVITDTETIKLV